MEWNGSMGHPQSILFPPSMFGQGLASVRLPCSLRNNAAAGLLWAPWNAVWCKRIPLKPERGFWSFIQTWVCCLGQHSCHHLWYLKWKWKSGFNDCYIQSPEVVWIKMSRISIINTAPHSRKGGNNTRCISSKRAVNYLESLGRNSKEKFMRA